jgi:molybdopterin/thiamine biosynthesis adenylyltransferase
MKPKQYNKRIRDIFHPEVLAPKRAVIIGAGSGGSRVATELGRLGVGLTLIDRPGECLEEHNIIRHVLGYDSLGKSKVLELRRHIHNFNPATAIECVEMDVTAAGDRFRQLVERTRPDVLLACTDNEQSKHAVNAVSVRLGIPTIGAGVYDGGVAGEVYLVRPRAACYGCLAIHLKRELSASNRKPAIDYNNLDLDEIRSTPALNTDIAQIALIHSRLALNLLLDGQPDLLGLPPEVNLIAFANRRVPGHFERPLHAEFYPIPRNPGCLICGQTTRNWELEAQRIMASLST